MPDRNLPLGDNRNKIDKAEASAIKFMILTKNVFGAKEFKITDKRLFSKFLQKNEGSELIKIALRPGGNAASRRLVELCVDIEVTTMSGWHCGTPNFEGCREGCDHCGTYCYPTFTKDVTSYCASWWEDGGGSEGGIGPGEGSGGGGYPPGGSGNPCDDGGLIVNGRVAPGPCSIEDEPGWVPTVPDDPVQINLTAVLNLDNDQSDWLATHPGRAIQIAKYLENSRVSNRNAIAVEHINRMMSDGNYLSFVEDHASTGTQNSMWWEDDDWLNENFRIFVDENFRDLTFAEKQFIKKHPIASWKFKGNAEKAFSKTQLKFPSNVTPTNPNPYLNTKADAYRHAYWMALNTIAENENLAREYGIAHESETPPLLYQEKDMDLFNNEVGIGIGKMYTDLNSLADFVYLKISEGKMKYFYPLDYIQSPRFDANRDGISDCNYCRNGFVPGFTTLRFTNN